jgi:hypothetical protein
LSGFISHIKRTSVKHKEPGAVVPEKRATVLNVATAIPETGLAAKATAQVKTVSRNRAV